MEHQADNDQNVRDIAVFNLTCMSTPFRLRPMLSPEAANGTPLRSRDPLKTAVAVLVSDHTWLSTPFRLRSTLSPAAANGTAAPPASAAFTVPAWPDGTMATRVPAFRAPPCST